MSADDIRRIKGLTHDDLASLLLSYQTTIGKEHIDMMGHMNVRWYFDMFSSGVGEVYRSFGITKEYVSKKRSGAFALETHIRYLTELREGDEVAVYTRFVGRSSKRFRLLQLMWNQSGERLASTFDAVFAHIDMRERRMSALPDDMGGRFDAILAEHEKLEWAVPVCGSMGV